MVFGNYANVSNTPAHDCFHFSYTYTHIRVVVVDDVVDDVIVVLCRELCEGRPPLQEVSPMKVIFIVGAGMLSSEHHPAFKVLESGSSSDESTVLYGSEGITNMLRCCLQIDPSQRLSAAELLATTATTAKGSKQRSPASFWTTTTATPTISTSSSDILSELAVQYQVLREQQAKEEAEAGKYSSLSEDCYHDDTLHIFAQNHTHTHSFSALFFFVCVAVAARKERLSAQEQVCAEQLAELRAAHQFFSSLLDWKQDPANILILDRLSHTKARSFREFSNNKISLGVSQIHKATLRHGNSSLAQSSSSSSSPTLRQKDKKNFQQKLEDLTVVRCCLVALLLLPVVSCHVMPWDNDS